MSTTRFSDAVQEAFATAKCNDPLIETIEVFHPSLIIKKSLEVCVMIDLWTDGGDIVDIVARISNQLSLLNEDLLLSYKNVKWSLISLAGDERVFETGNDFTDYATFRAAFISITPETNMANAGIYGPVIEAVAALDWSAGNGSVVRKLLYIGDTSNLTTELVNFTYEGQAECLYNQTPGAIRIFPGSVASQMDIQDNDWQDATTIVVSGFSDSRYNGTFNDRQLLLTTSWNFLHGEVDMTFSSELASNVTVNGSYLISYADTPTLAIAALQSKSISFNHLPSFYDEHLISMMTETGGVSLSSEELESNGLVRTNMGAMLASAVDIVSEDRTLYLVREMVPMNLTLENDEVKTFQPCGFKIELPEKSDSGLQDLNIAIDNTDGIVTDFLELAVQVPNQSIRIIYRPYLSSDLTQPQMNPPLVLYMTNASSRGSEVVGTASFSDVLNKTFLSEKYTLQRFPALR